MPDKPPKLRQVDSFDTDRGNPFFCVRISVILRPTCNLLLPLPPLLPTEPLVVETGGIVQDDRALVYRRTTLVEELPSQDAEFQSKRVKTVIDETSWIGDKPKRPSETPLPPPEATLIDAGKTRSWVTENPLYSASDYDSDYNNPLYVKMNETKMVEARQLASEGEHATQTSTVNKPHGEVDTLF